jgi:multiple sugar transport system permease protein
MLNRYLLTDRHYLWHKVRSILMGGRGKPGLLPRMMVYYLLICTGFIFLYPLLFMVSQSMKDVKDLLDPTLLYIPRRIFFENYLRAFNVLDYFPTLLMTVVKSVIPALLQTITCGMAGLALAKYRPPMKRLVIAILLLTFIVPMQVTMIPQFLMYKEYKMLGTLLPFIVPALFASGLNSSLFVLIYWQFFRSLPDSYIEAAELDGAGLFSVFFRIILPISIPAIVTVFLFSTVWGWNETYFSSLFLGDKRGTLPLALKTFADAYLKKYPITAGAGQSSNLVTLNESIRMAGTLLIILPLVTLYMFAQKSFVEAVERAGITGE